MRNFHASAWSWSSRRRGYVKRTQNMRNATNISLAKSTSGPSTFGQVAVVDAGDRPAAEEERGGERRERERGAELADEEEEEAEARVLDHVAGDELALGDGHVERRLRELGLRGDEEERRSRRTA